MQKNIDNIVKIVSGWEGVSAYSHRFGGTEFRYGKPEIGHIHSNGLIDIPFPMKIRNELINENLVRPHHILPETGWISFYVRKEEDIKTAVMLFRLSYLRYRIKRGKEISIYKNELKDMHISDSLRSIYEQMFP